MCSDEREEGEEGGGERRKHGELMKQKQCYYRTSSLSSFDQELICFLSQFTAVDFLYRFTYVRLFEDI